jgi:hypothetical protein
LGVIRAPGGAKVLSAPADIANVLSNAAQLVTKPVGYTMNNLRPFDVPVASATTFIGLSDLIILSVSESGLSACL